MSSWRRSSDGANLKRHYCASIPCMLNCIHHHFGDTPMRRMLVLGSAVGLLVFSSACATTTGGNGDLVVQRDAEREAALATGAGRVARLGLRAGDRRRRRSRRHDSRRVLEPRRQSPSTRAVQPRGRRLRRHRPHRRRGRAAHRLPHESRDRRRFREGQQDVSDARVLRRLHRRVSLPRRELTDR